MVYLLKIPPPHLDLYLYLMGYLVYGLAFLLSCSTGGLKIQIPTPDIALMYVCSKTNGRRVN